MINSDFKKLNQDLISQAESRLSEWFPQGKINGKEFIVGDLSGAPGKSLSVNMQTGVWKDFASGEGGADLISLYAAKSSLTQGEAYNDLKGHSLTKLKKQPIHKVTYKYTEDFSIQRVEYDDLTKAFYPNYKGTKKQHPEPRPLFKPNGFDEDKPTIICEGEKTALKIAELFTNYNSVTWPGGSNAVAKADWSQVINSKQILIWPDCDDAGYKAAAQISTKLRALAPDVKQIILSPRENNVLNREEGWDAVDLANHYDGEFKKILKWAQSVKVVQSDMKPPQPVEEKKQKQIVDKIPQMVKQGYSETSLANLQGLDLLTNSQGTPEPNITNCLVIFREHQKFKDKIYYDNFFCNYMVYDDLLKDYREINDVDAIDMQDFIQRHCNMKKITKTTVQDACHSIGLKKAKSTLEEWLESLTWDKTPRVDNFFKTYISSDMEDEYITAVSKNFLISMVARAKVPGCQVDNMVVLESRKQGTLKTSALRALVGEDYYSSMTGRIGTKDFLEGLRGNWLIELEELKCFKGSGPEEQKQAISSRSDTFRVPYGRYTAKFKRQSVFVGTTNKNDYIDDDSGARRFWPVKVNSVDVEAIKNDREQLFAEALHRYKNQETWWEVPLELQDQYTQTRNQAVVARHPWHDALDDFFFEIEGTNRDGWVTIKGLLTNVLEVPVKDHKRKDSATVTAYLKNAGFLNKAKRNHYKAPVKAWALPHHEKEAEYNVIRIQA